MRKAHNNLHEYILVAARLVRSNNPMEMGARLLWVPGYHSFPKRAITISQKCLTKFIKIQLSLFESLVLSAEHRPHYRESCAATFRLQKKVFF